MTEGNGNVTYSVKELLGQIQLKLENIDAKLNVKADRVELEHLVARMGLLEQPRPLSREAERYLKEFGEMKVDVADLKTRDKVTDALRAQVKWLAAMGVALAAAILGAYLRHS